MTVLAGFDLETTGLLAPDQRVVELALVLYDLTTRKRLASLVRRFNPGRPIEPGAIAVHGITFEAVAHLPTLDDSPDVIDKICQIAKHSVCWVAHNGEGFDMPFIRQELARLGHTLPHVECVDTMLQGGWATPFGKRPNLGELAFASRVPYDPSLAHAAEYDVDVMMRAFFFGLDRGFFRLPKGVTAAL